ncbi:MAG TPA: glycosyltransferase family 9 protein [Candidatus Baltobacteraceae bacterium]|jgi:ADP-heptose:LPS heptosyltransferase|nr:glycosyltransferase family 9 protein [Candidatus Baltobacteraceae bacterium]
MRIVLSRLDRVGDLILSTPAIRSVRRSWPAAHVTLACSRYNRVAVEGNPDLDELVALNPGESAEDLGARFAGTTDLAIALAPRIEDWRLARATRASRRIGYTYQRRYLARLSAHAHLTELVISSADPVLSERDPLRPVRHEVDQVLELVERAGGSSRCVDLVVVIDDLDRAAIAHLPRGAIIVHLAPRWLSGGSTPESFRALLRELRSLPVPLIVSHGADVREAAAEIAAEGLADAVVGDLPFRAWAALFEGARVVVTVDTGATHVASAVRRPMVVLYEHRFFVLASREWAPYRVEGVCLRKPPDERPESLERSRHEIFFAVQRLLEHA